MRRSDPYLRPSLTFPTYAKNKNRFQNRKATTMKDSRMIYPPIPELTENYRFNRYELVIAVAKGAHVVTSEYLTMRANAERMIAEDKMDKPMLAMIDPEYRDQKAIRIAITRLHEGKYRMLTPEEAAKEKAAE